MTDYKKHMQKCLKLAIRAEGKTSPNPMVGCVILDKNGKEIATGYHKKCGLAHAEAEALNKLTDEAQGGTLIVNLEPCSHQGKTPPCADLIIKKGIKKVIISMQDPNPIVAGKGIQKCKDAGLEIITGILENEAKEFNEVFIKNINEKKIFVAIKTATTIDGKIATKTGSSKWITSEKARKEVQKIRNRYDAILTTSSTIIKDNPSMTCRLRNGKDPIKVILDRELKTDFASKFYENTGEKIYLFYDKNIDFSAKTNIPKHIHPIKCPTNNCRVDLEFVFSKLYEIGIRSTLIEAGGKLNGAVISEGFADKIYHFIAPKILADNKGLSAFDGRDISDINDSINYKRVSTKVFEPDLLCIYKKL